MLWLHCSYDELMSLPEGHYDRAVERFLEEQKAIKAAHERAERRRR